MAGLTEKTAEPRFPNFKNIMAAKKKPLTVLSLADLGIAAGPAEAAYRSVMVSADTRPERAAGEGHRRRHRRRAAGGVPRGSGLV